MKLAKRIAGLGLSISLIAVLLLAVNNIQDIRDWMILRNYEPTERIAQITQSTSMTDYARKLFYLHDPQIDRASEFNESCSMTEETQVLGCYNGVKIFIYDVQDERLSGIHEVTAAHEMLHAAYDRLSDEERETVDVMTTRQFAKLSNDRIVSTIAAYRARNPAVVPNELHSILGSEVRDLNPELEQYYSRYFVDRLAIVTLSEKYEQVFIQNAAERDQIQASISLNKARLQEYEKKLQTDSLSINSRKAYMDDLISQQRYSEYNDLVRDYNNSVELYRAELSVYKSLIGETNDLIEQYNGLVTAQNELIKNLDSRATDI